MRDDGGDASVARERPAWKRLWRVGAAACALVIAAAGAGYPVYVRPQLDALRAADVILVLGGPSYGRYGYGFELATRGVAPALVVSNPNGSRDPWLAGQCTSEHVFALYCFTPNPSTTKGEGRELGRLARENGWRSAIVVTFTPHVSRARYILQQCFDGQLIMTAPSDRLSADQWVREYVLQTVGYARAALQPGC